MLIYIDKLYNAKDQINYKKLKLENLKCIELKFLDTKNYFDLNLNL